MEMITSLVSNGSFKLTSNLKESSKKRGENERSDTKETEPRGVSAIMNEFVNKINGNAEVKLDSTKWNIRNYYKQPKEEKEKNKKSVEEGFIKEEKDGVITIDVSMKQTASIETCVNAMLRFVGKMNSINIDECYNVSLEVDTLISSLEIVNSEKINVYINKFIPTINICNCTSVNIFCKTEESEGCNIITCKTLSTNLNYMKDGDWVEVPIPEQFSHTLKKDKLLQSTPTDLLF